MNYIITGKGYISELIKQTDADISIISEEDFRSSNFILDNNDKVYAPTESALEIILEKSEDIAFINAVNMLKDKYKFRKLMNNMYKNFYFKKVNLDDLESTPLDRSKKYIVKPVKGFFGTAVKELTDKTDISIITEEIRNELEENTKYFSESVLSKNELIIEQFIEGEEYAVDMYYNEFGEPEILNIYHHPIPDRVEYFHILYYTNKDIFAKFYDRLKTIFVELNQYLNIINFPIHAEFKLENEQLIPIEMNPLRYGGFGLADLAYHAFGFNPFNAFFSNFKPNWQKIWDKRNEQHFGWVLGYNGTDIDVETHTPNDEAYLHYLGETLHYVKIDHKENPVFSIAYVKDNSSKSLQRILATEFNDFFVPVKKGA
ncbi:MAG: ATP-grasp domain-containing protein [Candidatus Tenebribacter mawsonii]|nr:ATP-grasp domain-containing protein [Candidatus Tenebribacter mawsonii]